MKFQKSEISNPVEIDSDLDGYADQRTDSKQSDDCPNEYGKRTIFYYGCPDMDSAGWPDMKDGDTDGDGYMDMTELSANHPSDPLDPKPGKSKIPSIL